MIRGSIYRAGGREDQTGDSGILHGVQESDRSAGVDTKVRERVYCRFPCPGKTGEVYHRIYFMEGSPKTVLVEQI